MNIQVQLPGYLKSLPLPKTLEGFLELTSTQWIELVPFLLMLLILLYLTVSPCISETELALRVAP